MADNNYTKERTALLFVDPYNDFLSDGGKLWPLQHGITKVIVIGLLANTCIEATSRFAMELGYHVTLVRDAPAAFSKDRMHAAHELNGQTSRTQS